MENTEECQSDKYERRNHCLPLGKKLASTFWHTPAGGLFFFLPMYIFYLYKYRKSNDAFSKGNIF